MTSEKETRGVLSRGDGMSKNMEVRKKWYIKETIENTVVSVEEGQLQRWLRHKM